MHVNKSMGTDVSIFQPNLTTSRLTFFQLVTIFMNHPFDFIMQSMNLKIVSLLLHYCKEHQVHELAACKWDFRKLGFTKQKTKIF